MWTTLQIILIALGLLLAYTGNEISIPVLFYAGIGCLGLAMIAAGWEAILTKQLGLYRRRHWGRTTYGGVAAVFHGVQLNFTGLFIIVIAFMMHFDNGRDIFLHLVRRPGLMLVLLGGLCLLQAGITFLSTRAMMQSSRGFFTSAMMAAGLLPGLILVVVGLALGALGLFETLAPASFDEMGGALLEQLYGPR